MIERGRSVVGFFNDGKTALISHDWAHLNNPLFPVTLPRFTDRPKQNVSRKTKKVRKLVQSKIRRSTLQLVRFFRSQYYPTTAWTDFRLASLRNEDIVLNAYILMLVMGFAFAVSAFDFALLFLNTAYDISNLTGIDMKALLLIVSGVLATIGAWVTAFLSNMLSLAVMDGANRKVKCTTRSTVRTSLGRSSSVASTWLVIAFRCALPLIAVIAGGLLYLKFFYGVFQLPLVVWSVLVASMMTWSLWNFLRFSLAPFIVLFEQAPIPMALKKSSAMLKYRGKVFLLGIYVCLMASLALQFGLAYLIDAVIGYNKYLLFAVFAVASLIAINGVLVMLYRKRKLARY